MLRAIAVRPSSKDASEVRPVLGTAVLQHDERHLRRKTIRLTDHTTILVDLPKPVVLGAGDELVLDDGSIVIVAAADEPLHEVRGRNPVHLTELVWHIGNRHLAAAIAEHRVLILRDHVIKAMLEGLGADVRDVVAPFNPVRGAYSGHGHDHHDAQGSHTGHSHSGHSHSAHHHHHHD